MQTMVAGLSTHCAATAHRSSLVSVKAEDRSRTPLLNRNRSCVEALATCSPVLMMMSLLLSSQRESRG